MMAHREVTQEQFEHLLDDVTYLQDEAEALKYVIDQVPYSETPPDQMSILDMLRYLDFLQVHHFRPVVEEVFSENRILSVTPLSEKEKDFQTATDSAEKEETDVFTVLKKIIKHRAALTNVVRKIPLIDWERELKDSDGNRKNLFTFASEMVSAERKILKEIADLVLIHQNEKLSNREINQKVEQRKSEMDQ
ncbi:hypothetical protein [Rhodohalobacter mucosus]|uniref:Uncharacterized protein n=1 Tax=Rhodohalobacter mucosus TaxID=2079485 RepID=A0A316TXX4_9BACT|nr:hypothetical protein [Rhodohalobacter mucosus]PWN07554.1 hypothetical protein DDZ15_04675 [Rhodohalobacter mucosus]